MFDVLSEKSEKAPHTCLNVPNFRGHNNKRNGSNRGIAKDSTFSKIHNTIKSSLPCSQGQATITCKLFLFLLSIVQFHNENNRRRTQV